MFARDVNNAFRPLKFLVSATNIGRRSVTIKGIASREGKDQFIWANTKYFPKLLQPTEQVAEWSDNLTFITDKTTELCVFDTGGKQWKLPKKRLNELKKSAADQQVARRVIPLSHRKRATPGNRILPTYSSDAMEAD